MPQLQKCLGIDTHLIMRHSLGAHTQYIYAHVHVCTQTCMHMCTCMYSTDRVVMHLLSLLIHNVLLSVCDVVEDLIVDAFVHTNTGSVLGSLSGHEREE